MEKEFDRFWEAEIKPLAYKCTKGSELIAKLSQTRDEEEICRIKDKLNDYGRKDWMTACKIGQMVFYVEHDLADGRSPRLSMFDVKSVLTSDDYYTDVFNGEDCEEARNYRELGKKLIEGLEMLR